MTDLYNARLNEIRSNPQNIKLYAKSGCRHCYGRGYITGMLGRTYNKDTKQATNHGEYSRLCDCIYKNLRKEVEESLVEI